MICKQKILESFAQRCTAFSSNMNRKHSSVKNSSKPGKAVFISQSADIFSNLALEDWLYRNWRFEKRFVLFLWRNEPCVVVGRHQNPYIEANLPYLERAEVPIARRNSGGGTVYHDGGNLNCTFFTPRDRYDRNENLQTICDAVHTDFDIPADINKRDDVIVAGDKKISGTAAKLGRLSAYHHCTVLVSTDKLQLKLALNGDKTLISNATESTPSPTANLVDLDHRLTVDSVLASVGKSYLQRGLDNIHSDGFTLVNPTEDWFPGLDNLRNKLMSWEWIYGMTPKFTITRPVSLDPAMSEGSTVLVNVEAYHGLIEKITVVGRTGKQLKTLIEEEINHCLHKTRYGQDVFAIIEAKIHNDDCVKKYSSIH